MYKSKLQELCQQKSWTLPTYSHVREGPDHSPCFIGSVVVNGVTFQSSPTLSSTKQALNEAAKNAYVQFCDPQPSLPPAKAASPVSDSGISCGPKVLDNDKFVSAMNEASGIPENSTSIRKEIEQSVASMPGTSGPTNIIDGEESTAPMFPGLELVYKAQLTTFTLKKHLGQPTYSHERVGPPHNTRFKSTVTVDGKTFESPGLFRSLKEAEHAAAKAAFSHLCKGDVKEEDIIQFKTHLRALCQKQGFGMPAYYTNSSGTSNNGFVSMVVIDGETFEGSEGRNKKQAETYAAKVAYTVLLDRALHGPHVGNDPRECSKDVDTVKGSETISKGVLNGPLVGTDARECSQNVDAVKDSEAISKELEPSRSAITSQSSQSSTTLISKQTSCARYKKVMVFPRSPDMQLPSWVDACHIHPISNDEWVAVTMNN